MAEKQTIEMNLGKRHHGADVIASSLKYGIDSDDILDFSSNVNIFSCEIDYDKVIASASKAINSYPDIGYTNLRKKLSKVYDVDEEYIIPGNGATELIYLVMRLPGINHIGIFDPTFCEYKRAAGISGKNIRSLSFDLLDKDNNEMLEKEIDKLDMIVICNPNNPTGEIRDIETLLDVADKKNVRVFADETFIGFTENIGFSLMSKIKKHRNLIVLKAATKLHSVPGIRLGYAFTSDAQFMELMWRYKEPWTVNVFAEAISDHIYCDELLNKTKEYYKKEIIRLKKMYTDTGCITCSDTTTNFLLLRFENRFDNNMTSHHLKEYLLKNHKILIRDCSEFEGLDESYIRIAIKEDYKNDRLYMAIKNFINK